MLQDNLSGLVDPDVLDIFLAISLVLESLLSIVGVAGNIISIVVFSQQGYRETTNISLTALACSDIGAILTLQLRSLMLNPWTLNAKLIFNPVDFSVMFSTYPHNYFIRVSGFITAYIAFELRLCVLMPLQIKNIITRIISFSLMVVFYLITFLNILPIYLVNDIGWIKSPNTNTTFLGIIFRQNRDAILSITYFIIDLAVPYFTFAIIILCTSFTVTSLMTSSSWRKSLAGAESDVSSRRYRKERKLISMLTVISVLFICFQIPQSVFLAVVAVIRKLSVRGMYFDITVCCYCAIVLLENINSAVNPLVYYKMSKKYRDTCRKLFTKYLSNSI
jgi:7 transmembrane receptor (rhodopsin family)